MTSSIANHGRQGLPLAQDVGNREKAPRDSRDLIDATTRLIKAFPSGQVLAQGQALQLNAPKLLLQSTPIVFDRKGIEVNANNWIDRLKKIFCMVSSTIYGKGTKVKFAIYNLVDVADAWWKATCKFLQ